jgi:hypothetical protein
MLASRGLLASLFNVLRIFSVRDYLLEERNFTALKEYIDFLDNLPPVLREIQGFTESYSRQHAILTPPNSRMLIQTAKGNTNAWQGIRIAIPTMGEVSGKAVLDTRTFIEEFHSLSKTFVDRRLKINSLDIKGFSLTRSSGWGNAPPKDVIDLMRELWNRLNQCESAIMRFRSAVTAIGETLHSIFVRFIESLTLALCSCDAPIPKIEAYYTIRKLGLPGMQYDPELGHSEQARLEQARDHVTRLKNMRIRANSAVDNLTDFCYRLQYFLADARSELQANHPARSLSRSGTGLTMTDRSLVEVKEMSGQLMKMSRKLNQ